MAQYPIKMLKDEAGNPMVPLTSPLAVRDESNTTLQDWLNEKITQYNSMPSPSANTLDKIVQYIGTTNSTYTKGYFYLGISDGAVTPTYSWQRIDVQPGSSGSNDILYLVTNNGTALTGNYSDVLSECARRYENGEPFMAELYIGNLGLNYTGAAYLLCMLSGMPGEYALVFAYQSNTANSKLVFRTVSFNADITTFAVSNVSLSAKDEYSLVTENSQTFTGSKIFSNVPYCATAPSHDTHLVNKKYVDDSIANAITSALGGSY